ncbi:MAG: tRNA (N(6)-L-threonylcarbamoyladenosine(37)-C(2))-methylthiotransferase MtaB [Candidatus Moraniibacteriota bacterium]
MDKINRIKNYALGCKVNQYESDCLASGLSQVKNIQRIAFNSSIEVDFVLINTCSVTGSAVAKSRKIIKKAIKENPKAKLYITGCATQVYPERFSDLINDKVKLGDVSHQFLEKVYEEAEVHFFNKKSLKNYRSVSPVVRKNKSRYFLKIQDGCNQFCSYCIIPYARKNLLSRSAEDIIGEIKKAEEAGFKEIVLSGIHIGRYSAKNKKGGRDNLCHLLKKILKETKRCRIRLSSIEVNEVSLELIKIAKQSPRICRHFHIPLQSGSGKILKLMNRPYGIEYFWEKINIIKKEIPEIFLTADVIVGFPSETEEDFLQTFNFCRKAEFGKIHVFSYSEHQKTQSSSIFPKIGKELRIKRANNLRSLSDELKEKSLKNIQSQNLEIIIEKVLNKNSFLGKSSRGFDIIGEFSRISGAEKKCFKKGENIDYYFDNKKDKIF